MVTPPLLKIGNTVGVVSTARKVTTVELQPFLSLLENWGLKYLLGKTINAQDNQFAGDDALRAKDFQEMMDNPEINAIWCTRGGYGTVRIIDELDFTIFRKAPKWIIGYSDATVLHSHVHQFGIETLHANMAIEIDTKTFATRNTIKEALFENNYEIRISCEGNNQNRTGTARVPLVGGNLSLLYSLIGSPSEINTDGKILFIEDLDEMLYHTDRMLQNLKRNGLLKNIAGLVVGGMSDMRDNIIPYGKSAKKIILDAVSKYNYPLCFDFPAGHLEDNRALILGRTVFMEVTNNAVTLRF